MIRPLVGNKSGSESDSLYNRIRIVTRANCNCDGLATWSAVDQQSSEPGFESPFVTVSKIGHFRSLY